MFSLPLGCSIEIYEFWWVGASRRDSQRESSTQQTTGNIRHGVPEEVDTRLAEGFSKYSPDHPLLFRLYKQEYNLL